MSDTKISLLTAAATLTGSELLPGVQSGGNVGISANQLKTFIDPFDAAIDYASKDISITTTATATLGRQHVCTGTTADYTVTLPAVAGNAGKLLAVRMDAGLTKLVTIQGNGAELIDGSNTRIMWANETATLYCDGVGWSKLAGKSLPMSAYMSITGTNTPATWAAGTITKLKINNIVYSFPASMSDISNSKLWILRSGVYTVSGSSAPNNTNGLATTVDNCIYVNGSLAADQWAYCPASSVVSAKAIQILSISTGAYIELYLLHMTGSYTTSNIYPGSAGISIMEITTW